MRCPVCNIEAAAGASFCPKCGAKLPLVEGAGSEPAARQTLSGAASDSGTSSARGRSGDVPEEILWQGSYSPKAMVGSYVLGGVASLALIAASIWLSGDWYWMIPAGAIVVLWVLLLGKLAIQRLGVHYKLTNQMFYHQRGVLTRVTDRIEFVQMPTRLADTVALHAPCPHHHDERPWHSPARVCPRAQSMMQPGPP